MEEPSANSPQRTLIGSRAELASALLALIGRARQQLRLAAANLSDFALGDAQPADVLRKLLVADRNLRIRLLVDDMSWLDSSAPRLRSLQRTFPHALLIRRAHAQDPVGRDTVAIGDARDALRLLPSVGIRGELWCENGPFARPLIAAFERRWERASHDQPSQPLGL